MTKQNIDLAMQYEILIPFLSIEKLNKTISLCNPEFSVKQNKSEYNCYVKCKTALSVLPKVTKHFSLIKIYQHFIFKELVYRKRYELDRLCNIFQNKYLLPTLDNTWNKIKMFKINYFEEHPLKDCFEIAFLNFIKNSSESLPLLRFIKHKIKSSLEKKIILDISDKKIRVSDIHNEKYDTEGFFNYLASIEFISVLRYCLFKHFIVEVYLNEESTINKFVSEINGFHISNAIALNKFSSNILERINELKYNFDSEMKTLCESLMFHNLKNSNTTDATDFIMPIILTNNEIKSIISPSKHESIDTFIDENILDNYESLISTKYSEIKNMFDVYADKFIINGLQDIELMDKIINIWSEHMKDVIEFTDFNESELKFDIKFSDKNLIGKDIALETIGSEDFKNKYKDHYSTLLIDTENLFDTFYLKSIEIFTYYKKYVCEVLEYVQSKLIDNSVVESNYNLIEDLKTYILSDNRNVSSIKSVIRQGIVNLYL